MFYGPARLIYPNLAVRCIVTHHFFNNRKCWTFIEARVRQWKVTWIHDNNEQEADKKDRGKISCWRIAGDITFPDEQDESDKDEDDESADNKWGFKRWIIFHDENNL